MKTEEQIRQKLNELHEEWLILTYRQRKLIVNKQIKLLEWVLDQENIIEINVE